MPSLLFLKAFTYVMTFGEVSMAGDSVPLSAQTLSALESLSFPKAPAGKPRLNPLDRRLHDFYEPLTLLSILVPSRRAGKPKPASELEKEGKYRLWHKYLDQLSWLCDHKSGGQTVSSIAVQATAQGPFYWLAANLDPSTRALSHLEYILRELGGLHTLSPDEQQMVEDAIVAQSISLSSERVKNYSRWLCKSVDSILERRNTWLDQIGLSNSTQYRTRFWRCLS